jgi:hypothetical protein
MRLMEARVTGGRYLDIESMEYELFVRSVATVATCMRDFRVGDALKGLMLKRHFGRPRHELQKRAK